MKKVFLLLLTSCLIIIFSSTVYARKFPSNIDDWTEKDWDKWNKYWEEKYEENEYPGWRYWRPNEERHFDRHENWHPDKERRFDRREDWCPDRDRHDKSDERCDRRYDDNYNYYNFSNCDYWDGVIDVYDAPTEDQAQILAKIIYLYSHAVPSQTAQACVGWAVMNSVDASGSGVNIGMVAPNFHYNQNLPTTDDFDRDLVSLARDIIFRWRAGRAGVSDNGRVLPANYYYVTSTGGTSVLFSTAPNSGSIWNYSYATPYEN